MQAVLRIYNSIEDQEPSKVFTCYRTTMGINNKLEALTEEINLYDKDIKAKLELITENTADEEIEQIKDEIKKINAKISELTLDIIRLFFPNFTEEDFIKLDPYDYQTFIFEIGEMRNKIYNRAAKN